jgi:hypothetical protein
MMTGEGRKWLAPLLSALKGPDVYPLTIIFNSLTEYFRRSVGVWFEVNGTTDGTGHLIFNHNAPFTPSGVFVTEFYISGKPHDMGPFHIHSITDTEIDVHFLKANSGNDRDNDVVRIFVLCLP